MIFPCTRCGLCCQHIDKVELLRVYDRGDGVCIHYKPGLGCTVYEIRPLACRIDDGYQAFASNQMSQQEYYHINAQVCNKLQEVAGLPLNWRVSL